MVLLYRPYTRVSGLGAGERWRKPEKESWMSLVMTMTMMTRNKTPSRTCMPLVSQDQAAWKRNIPKHRLRRTFVCKVTLNLGPSTLTRWWPCKNAKT